MTKQRELILAGDYRSGDGVPKSNELRRTCFGTQPARNGCRAPWRRILFAADALDMVKYIAVLKRVEANQRPLA